VGSFSASVIPGESARGRFKQRNGRSGELNRADLRDAVLTEALLRTVFADVDVRVPISVMQFVTEHKSKNCASGRAV